MLFLVVLTACSTTDSTGPSVSMQDRREFEELKYRDPVVGAIPPGIRPSERAFVKSISGLRKKVDDVQEFATFAQVGPWNIGGRTRAFAIDVTDTNTLYAGGVSGGIWRSNDGGNSWMMLTNPADNHTVTSLAQDRRIGNTHKWYYCTGEAWGNSAQISGNGIFKSSDGGGTWNVLPSTVNKYTPSVHAFAYGWRIATDPADTNDAVYLATSRYGITRSTDGGATWQTVLATNSFFADIAVTESGVKYAALSSFTGSSGVKASKWGVYRSLDGVNWTNITPLDMNSNVNRLVIGLFPSTSESFFIIGETPGTGTNGKFRLSEGIRDEWHSLWKYEYLSGDGTGAGGRWENRSNSIPLFGGRNGDFFSQGGYDLTIAVSPADTNLVFLGGTNLYRSTDAFRSPDRASWIGGYGPPIPGALFNSYPRHHPDQHAVAFNTLQPNIVWSLNDGGVMRTNQPSADSVEWIDHNRGYYTTQFYAIAIRNKENDNRVLGGMQDNGTWQSVSADSSEPWIRRNGGDGAYCYVARDGLNLYVSTQSGRVRRVILDENGNEIARTRVDPIGPVPADYLFINPFAIDPSDEKIMFLAAGPILYRCNDLTGIPLGRDDSTSVNWDSLPATRTPGVQISAVAVTNKDHRVYYGTAGGKLYRLDNAHIGQPTPAEKLAKSGFLNNITIHPDNSDFLLAVYSNYGVVSIYASSNGGDTWSAVSGNLEENIGGGGSGPAVNWTAILPYNKDTTVYIAATSSGLFFAPQLNGMSTVWTPLAEQSIGNVPSDMVVTRSSDKSVFVGTHGRGVFKGFINTIPPKVQPPTLLSPVSSTRGVLLDVVLKWNRVPEAVSYTVEVSATADFSTDVNAYDGLSADTHKVQSLEQGPVTYYWRVFAFGPGGRSEPSEAWSFQTAVRPPVLIYPPSGATDVVDNPVSLSWERVQGAISYDVEVATNFTFANVIYSRNSVTDTTSEITGIESNKRYFWHVRSVSEDTAGVWAQRSLFNTGIISSVVTEQNQSVLSLAPNPASDKLLIETRSDWYPPLVISVIDMAGKTVIERVADTAAFTLDVRSLSPGSYILNVRHGINVYKAPFQIVR